MVKIIKQKYQGFTLIELLVVIAIIGMLASVILASLSSARAKALDAKRIADKNQIRTAFQLYYNVNNTFPSSGGNWKCFGAPATENCWRGSYVGLDSLNTEMQPYLPTIPTQISDAGTYAYQRFLYRYPTTIGTHTGAYLIWVKEGTMTREECASDQSPNKYDKYWYCYEYLGN